MRSGSTFIYPLVSSNTRAEPVENSDRFDAEHVEVEAVNLTQTSHVAVFISMRLPGSFQDLESEDLRLDLLSLGRSLDYF